MTNFESTCVEIAFGTFLGVANWTDVSQYVRSDVPININRGRPDQFADVQPGSCQVTFDNKDGRFTAGNASGAYYPNVKIGQKLRVTSVLAVKNWITNPTFEASVGSWSGFAFGYDTSTITQSNTHVHDGAQALKMTYANGTQGGWAGAFVRGLTIGSTYTMSAWVYVPTGSPDVHVDIYGVAAGAATSTKNAFVRISCTFVATQTSLFVAVTSGTATTTTAMSVWVDSAQLEYGAAVTTFDATAAVWVYRYTGYITAWPATWVGSIESPRVTVTALDRLRKFGQAAELRAMLSEEILLGLPFMYYPLSEPVGSVTVGSISQSSVSGSGSIVQVGAGGTCVFGSGIGPGTDGLTAVQIVRASAGNGKYLSCPVTGISIDGGFAGSIEVWFATTTADQTLLQVGHLSLAVSAAGKLDGATGYGGTHGVSTASVTDGATHHAVFVADAIFGGAGAYTLYLDGAVVATGTSPGMYPLSAGGRASIGYAAVQNAGVLSANLGNATLSHAAAYMTQLAAGDVTRRYNAGLNGTFGESSDARIGRILDYLLVPTGERSLEAGLSTALSAQPLLAAQPLSVMQDVTRTESGVLFIAPDGTTKFQARSHRYNQASTLSLLATQLAAIPEFAIDDVLLATAGNDVFVARPNGATMRRTNQASVSNYGPYKQTLSILTTTDTESAARGEWQVLRYGEPGPRCPAVTVDLRTVGSVLSFASLAALAGLDVGSRFAVTALPATAPSSSISVVVEGYTEQISQGSHTIAYNCSNVTDDAVWTLDDATYSQLDQNYRISY